MTAIVVQKDPCLHLIQGNRSCLDLIHFSFKGPLSADTSQPQKLSPHKAEEDTEFFTKAYTIMDGSMMLSEIEDGCRKLDGVTPMTPSE